MVNCKWGFGNIISYLCDPVRYIHSPIHHFVKFVIDIDVALQYQAKVIIDALINDNFGLVLESNIKINNKFD